MESDDIKQKIKLAMESVRDVPEPFKLKAFEVVLASLLASHTTIATVSRPQGNAGDGENEESLDQKIENLCRITGLSIDQLKDVFHFGAEEPTFIGRINGNEKEKQVQVSRLLLFVLKYAYGQDWVKGSFLWKALKDYGVGSLDNLAHNLETDADNFRIKGKGRGCEYKLTQQGETTAKESLKQFVTK